MFLNGAELRAMEESMVRTDPVLDPHAGRPRRDQLRPVTDTMLEGQPDHDEHPALHIGGVRRRREHPDSYKDQKRRALDALARQYLA